MQNKNYAISNIILYDPLVPREEKDNRMTNFLADEICEISRFFNYLKLSGILMAPYVFLSDRIIYRSYGKFSVSDLILELEKYFANMGDFRKSGHFMKMIHEIIDVLKDILNMDKESEKEAAWTYISKIMSDIDRMILSEGTEEEKAAFSELMGILSNRKIADREVLGEYIKERHQIIIYYRAIKESIWKYEDISLDFYAKVSMVLAHEYFHAMHYAVAPGHTLWNNSAYRNVKGYQKREIREALADFFSVLWCYEKAKDFKNTAYMNVANERFDSWKKQLYSAWPYAKAMYLMRDHLNMRLPDSLNEEAVNNGCSSLFSVFETSVNDIIGSYELLMKQ